MRLSSLPAFKPVLFAGQNEFKAALTTMRGTIPAVKDELSFLQTTDQHGKKLAAFDAQEKQLREQLAKATTWYQKAAINAQILAVTNAGRALAAWDLGRAVVHYGGDLDGKAAIRAKAHNPEKAAKMEEAAQKRSLSLGILRAAVGELRNETDAAKDQWVKDFETETQKPLDSLETYVMKEWVG